MGAPATRVSAAALVLACLASCSGGSTGPARAALPESLPPGPYRARSEAQLELAKERRPELLRRTRVRHAQQAAVVRVDLSREPGDAPIGEFVACRFELSEPSGTTPKFDCVRPDGEVLRVKYGGAPEIPAEVAATRLVSALGFGADHVALVRTLRCFGCPREPYFVTKALDRVDLAERYARGLDYGTHVDFDWVSVERKHPGRTIVAGEKGWAWHELDLVDEASGGSPRAEVDALRLLAVFLAHWDNKLPNQRLVCLDGAADDGCSVPFAVVQDLGATFGPLKANLERWRETPVWADPAGCRVTMTQLPYGGTTFHDTAISETGRALLADALGRLSRAQVEALFAAARFAELAPLYRPRPVQEWADAFEAKVREIRSRRCDAAPPRSAASR
jgi:hypothetical protein